MLLSLYRRGGAAQFMRTDTTLFMSQYKPCYSQDLRYRTTKTLDFN